MAYEGTLVGGRFAIERLAGRGGMGTVYRATDRTTGAPAAIKILHDNATAEAAARFARERRLLAELAHPGFVRHLADGELGDGLPFLAMEWLEGEDLASRLRRTGLAPREAVALVGRVATALGVAHARGVVHRDVKPSNVFIAATAEPDALTHVKILDLGIARLAAGSDMTRTGAAIGTPRYMAPEQARGTRELDARADVFSLGCVLYECLVGHPPFTGDTPMAVLAKILLEDAPALREARPDLPHALEALVARLLAKDPDARPRDGAAVAAALAGLGELGVAGETLSRARDSAITIGEQRLVCVVFAQTIVAGTGTLELLQLAAPRDPGTPRDTLLDASDAVRMALAFDAEGTLDASSPDAIVPALSRAVSTHGGRAEVLADGSVVVTVLGDGTATDQAARAARCALAVRDVVPRCAMALAMGRCVVAERVPFGELIDRAARLLGPGPVVAPAGPNAPIRVDEVSAGLLDVRFAIAGDERGLVLLGERDVADPARTLLGKPTACVGRERELATLSAILEETIAEPMAHVVVVTAPSGVGKSRVRHELLQRIGDRAEVWIGRGDPLTAGAPFAMLAQALRRAAGIADGETLAVRHMKLRARVTRNVPAADATFIAEFLGELVGAPLTEDGSMQLRAARRDPQLMGDQMLRACEDFFAAECAAHPVVLVLEDLQWSDVATVRFVDAILRQLPDRPIFVIAFARPEVDAMFPRLWAERHVERMALAELTRRAAEKLVREALGAAASEAIVARVVERAAGNAFYLEELVRSVAEGHGDSLPETVVAMAQARIEGLEPEARHVLRAASIYGQVFWRSAIAALVGESTQVHAWIEELVRRELVTARRDSRFAGEPEYGFRHSLVREAAYAMLPDKDRVSGHRLAGAWLEQQLGAAGGADAVMLAEHFERAKEPSRSAGWYRKAAEQAIEADDLAGAIERAERAIACSPDDPAQVGALRQLQSGAHAWRGEYALASARAIEAMARLPVASAAWFAAAAARADACTRLLEHGAVTDLGRALVAATVGPGTYRGFCQAIAMTMATLLWHADASLVEGVFAKLDTVEAAIGISDPSALAWILNARSWRAMARGDLGTCLELDLRVVECFAAVGDLRHACQQRASVGYDERMLGAFVRAERSLADAVAVADRLGAFQVSASAKHNLGLALAYQGRIEEARAVETDALAMLVAQGNKRLAAAANAYLAVIESIAGNHALAIQRATVALEEARDMPALTIQFEANLANAHRLAGDPTRALEHATHAVRLMELHGRPEEGEQVVLLAYAEALHASGQYVEARTSIETAVDRLDASAALISDPAWRTSFLECVPENHRTRALARVWRLAT